MKKLIIFCYLMLLPGIFNQLEAQDDKLKIKGEFLLDQRIRIESNPFWSWNETRISMNLDKKTSGSGRFFSNIWVRNFGFPSVNSITQLQERNSIISVNAEIREAWFEVKDAFIPNMDIKIGRQRISWGTADKVGPSDLLNPPDLENIWDFGRYNGSDAIKFSYFLKNDSRIEFCWLPFFRPGNLPSGDWIDVLIPEITLPPYLTLKSYRDSLILPNLTLRENGSYGARYLTRFKNIDLAAVYAYNYNLFPFNSRTTINPSGTLTTIEILSELCYMRQQAIGLNMAGEIKKMGVWSEIVAFFPEKEMKMITDLSAFGLPDQDSIILKKEPYVKYIAGGDYTFKNKIYLNLQYLHGFYHETGKDNLNDYFLFNAERKFIHDKLNLALLSGAFVVSDFKNLSDNYAIIYTPQIAWLPNDNTQIALGVYLLEGKGNSMFARVKDKDELFLKMKYNF